MLEDDALGDLGPRRPVKLKFNKLFKALGSLGRQHDRERLGLCAGGWLGHALLLHCERNAFKLILANGGRGLPIAVDGISNDQDRKP